MIPEPGGRVGFSAWFVLGVVISLAVHMIFFERSRDWKIPGFSAESYDMIVPRTFRMKHVEIDPATLEEPMRQPEERKREPKPIDLPPESPFPESQKTRDSNPGIETSVMKVPALRDDRPVSESKRGDGAEPRLDAATMKQLMEGNGKAPTIPLDPLKDLAEGSAGMSPAPAFSSLDSLLEANEKLTSATAPILMPTDLLFGYDSTSLKPGAAKSLEKLGTLIMRNGSTRFRIEGHTDSFGSDDYNNALSLRRAEEVKSWLVRHMAVDPARISTAGLGKARLLAPGTGTIAEQELNRRVEIIITPGDSTKP